MKYKVKIGHEFYCDADAVRSMLRLQCLLEELLDGLTPMQSENLDNVLETLQAAGSGHHQIDVQLMITKVEDFG